MVHPAIALERLRYHSETSQVGYYARHRDRCGTAESSAARIFPALDFLAALCIFRIPDSSWCVTAAPSPMCAGPGFLLTHRQRLSRPFRCRRIMRIPVVPMSSRAGSGAHGLG
jgi:hypothetical protein